MGVKTLRALIPPGLRHAPTVLHATGGRQVGRQAAEPSISRSCSRRLVTGIPGTFSQPPRRSGSRRHRSEGKSVFLPQATKRGGAGTTRPRAAEGVLVGA
jgi:hypothetical protein